MVTKILKLFLSVLVTKWIADVAFRAAHDPRVENVESRVRRWTSDLFKKVLMTALGAVFAATGLVMTLMSAAGRLDRGLSMFSYKFGMAFFIFAAGLTLIALASRKKLGEGRRTRPQLIDAPF